MKKSGFADKLVLNKQGDVKNQYTNKGQKKIGDYDMVPIIDTFIKKHPDFSYGGSKGVIAETGYNGTLGYRSSKSQYGDTKKTHREAQKATKVANAMKKDGWQFASHSWGHINMTESGIDDIKNDTALWQKEVQPIVGKTPVLIFPFGADIGSFTNYTDDNEKYTYLKNKGFSIFDNVDASQTSWGQFLRSPVSPGTCQRRRTPVPAAERCSELHSKHRSCLRLQRHHSAKKPLR